MNDTSSLPKKAKWSRQAKINVYIVGSLLAGGAIGFLVRLNAATGPSGLFIGLISLAMMIGVGATIYYTKLLDELARHTHEAAFYWSAVFSLAICFVPIAALIGFPKFALPSLEILLGTKTHAFAAGMAASILVLLVSYFAIWTHLWLKRNRA
ncbi:hypothetical protein [Aquidulcibacter sp.]|jgi:hypothetical protein|uniref:hypothetical protein n=1 Tax=Aquidulcibacter sp. TaxID=2052990 RepID=UPI0037BF1835